MDEKCRKELRELQEDKAAGIIDDSELKVLKAAAIQRNLARQAGIPQAGVSYQGAHDFNAG